MDPSILSGHFGSQIENYLNALGDGRVAVQREPQILPNVIAWCRKPMTKLDQEMVCKASASEDHYIPHHTLMMIFSSPTKYRSEKMCHKFLFFCCSKPFTMMDMKK